MKTCPVCKREIKKLNPRHIKLCFGEDPSYKIKYIVHNFPLIEDYELIKKLYIEDKYSIPMICDFVGGLDFKSMVYVLNEYGIEIRSIKETRSLNEYRQRIESTNIKKYGSKNPLSKGTIPWNKRNKTVIDKYGVENVWQCIDDFVDEFGHRSKISKLNQRISQILKAASIEHQSEYRIKYSIDNKTKWKFYDFKIGNFMLEVNGDYWHANPEKYKKEQIFKFPNGDITAEQIWNLDKYKKEIAELNGYQTIYLWESEINKLNDDEILHYIKDKINQKD